MKVVRVFDKIVFHPWPMSPGEEREPPPHVAVELAKSPLAIVVCFDTPGMEIDKVMRSGFWI